MVLARVREWHAEEGWGVVDSENTPGGCWVHFSHVDVDGYRALTDVGLVELSYERADQDGFAFRATVVTVPGRPRSRHAQDSPTGGAHGSSLSIRWDE